MPKTEESGPQLRELPLSVLCECEHNPRTHFNQEKLEELTRSVRTYGVVTPLIARPVHEFFEIGAGHRRYRAAIAAGLKTVPVMVRIMNDEEFTELLNLENLQREDLNPLEEAEGYRQLMALPGRDVHQVADRVGKSTKYVHDRIKLLELEPEPRSLLEDGTITVGHAILIARLKPEDQDLVVEKGLFEPEDLQAQLFCAGEDEDHRKPVSVRELDSWIDARIRFDRDRIDPLVHEQAHRTLYEAQDAEEALKVVPITLLYSVPPSARAEERTLCRSSWARADGEPDFSVYGGSNPKPSKTCEHSVLGVIVVGPARGEVFEICTAKKKCRVHWSESSKAKKAKQTTPKRLSDLQKKREAEEAKREAWERVKPKVLAALRVAAATAPADPTGALGQLVIRAWRTERKAWTAEDTAEDLVRELALTEMRSLVDDARWQGPSKVNALAKSLGVDLKPLLKESAKQSATPAPAKARKSAKARRKGA